MEYIPGVSVVQWFMACPYYSIKDFFEGLMACPYYSKTSSVDCPYYLFNSLLTNDAYMRHDLP